MKDKPFNHHDEQDRQLWRQFAEASGWPEQGADRDGDQDDTATPNPIDPNLLAAYLDGSASPGEVESVERQMAQDPSVLDMIVELHQLQGLLADNGKAADESGSGEAHDQEYFKFHGGPGELATRVKALVPGSGRDAANPLTPVASTHRPYSIYAAWWPAVRSAVAAVLVLAAGWVGYEAGEGSYTVAPVAPHQMINGTGTGPNHANRDDGDDAMDFMLWFDDLPMPLFASMAGGGR